MILNNTFNARLQTECTLPRPPFLVSILSHAAPIAVCKLLGITTCPPSSCIEPLILPSHLPCPSHQDRAGILARCNQTNPRLSTRRFRAAGVERANRSRGTFHMLAPLHSILTETSSKGVQGHLPVRISFTASQIGTYRVLATKAFPAPIAEAETAGPATSVETAFASLVAETLVWGSGRTDAVYTLS